ncbi:MAG: hypothetical protein WAW61_13180 [Methylococcaceae bacterium]
MAFNSTLSDFIITQSKPVIPAWIAGAEDREANPGSMDGFELTIHGTGYPLLAGITSLSIIWLSRIK